MPRHLHSDPMPAFLIDTTSSSPARIMAPGDVSPIRIRRMRLDIHRRVRHIRVVDVVIIMLVRRRRRRRRVMMILQLLTRIASARVIITMTTTAASVRRPFEPREYRCEKFEGPRGVIPKSLGKHRHVVD